MTFNETIDDIVAQTDALIEAHNLVQDSIAPELIVAGLTNAQAALAFNATKEYGVLTQYKSAILSLKIPEPVALPPIPEQVEGTQ